MLFSRPPKTFGGARWPLATRKRRTWWVTQTIGAPGYSDIHRVRKYVCSICRCVWTNDYGYPRTKDHHTLKNVNVTKPNVVVRSIQYCPCVPSGIRSNNNIVHIVSLPLRKEGCHYIGSNIYYYNICM